ncbi:hypothetical protein HY492_00225 [Candidatus Woesearchaeota archaeon]|nr:hypothetical protein [Candidatus Woesearchaeota archaeon]
MGLKKWVIGIFAALAAIPSALAHCPVCTAATAVAVGAGRVYGVDDAIMGVLIGGFIVSSALWLNNVCKRRNWVLFPGQGVAIVLASVALTIVGFQKGGLFSGAVLWGLPRLLSGMLVGTGFASAGEGAHAWLRKSNHGKNHLPLQGMIVLLASLLVATMLFVGGVL